MAAVWPCRTSQREVLAYKALAKSSLGPFLCKFHRIRKVGDVQYMELDSAYAGLQGPTATMDIKIGKKTWEDDASPAKVAKESKKFDEVYSKSSAMDGFRVAGMKAGDLVLKSSNLKARFSLKTEEFASWLLPAFFACPPGFGQLPAGVGEKPDARGLRHWHAHSCRCSWESPRHQWSSWNGLRGNSQGFQLAFYPRNAFGREMHCTSDWFCTLFSIQWLAHGRSWCKLLRWSPEPDWSLARLVSTVAWTRMVYLLWTAQVIAFHTTVLAATDVFWIQSTSLVACVAFV